MKKRLFLYLLKKYTKTEKGRLEVYKELNNQSCMEYHESSGFNNFYKSYLEFIMANWLVEHLVINKMDESFKNLKLGVINVLEEGIQILKVKNYDGL